MKRFPVMLTEPQIRYLDLDAHEHSLTARDLRDARSWASISRAARSALEKFTRPPKSTKEG
jgi:hypothetical protein